VIIGEEGQYQAAGLVRSQPPDLQSGREKKSWATALDVGCPVLIDWRKRMKIRLLERAQIIPRPRSEVFAFFSDAFNLERITPPFLRFRILTPPPIIMAAGTVIEYRLRLFGAPIFWRTLIESWGPEESFVDIQIKGPYSLWRHTHSFEEIGSGQTLMRDTVEYALPFGLAGRLAHHLFVRRWLDEIFDYRATMTARLFGMEDKEERKVEPLRAIAG
jgi:ligand-binding SRPBCC domain-containing protein